MLEARTRTGIQRKIAVGAKYCGFAESFAGARRLRAMRAIMLGAVLTKFDPLKSGNRYSEYYGYDYYQYEDKSSKAA